ncbi:putative bifunctional diguanylate cyclase/phosphodiesterase [Angustibacter aerolatus]
MLPTTPTTRPVAPGPTQVAPAADPRTSERLALSLLDAMEAATCAVDRAGRITAVNRAWREETRRGGGRPARSGIGVSYLEVCEAAGGDEPVARAVAAGIGSVLDGTAGRFELEYLCPGPTGDRWFSVRVNPLSDDGAVVSHVDVTAMKSARRALRHLTLHDALTGLPNRLLLADRMEQALVRAGRTGASVAVAFLDVDRFQLVNDALGHPAGDELLQALASRLRGLLRPDDTLARFAGDEFVVVWPDVAPGDEAEQLAQRVAEAFRDPFELTGGSVRITASVGYAVGRHPQRGDDLLLDADAAMHDAKSRGRQGPRRCTDDLREQSASRRRIEADLVRGIAGGELAVHYQPVVDLRTRTVVGVEALVRWHHPDGLRMPDTFIPVAEATGLIVPLGAWVLEEACRQGAAWAAVGLDLRVAVNFSARQIGHSDVIPGIRHALEGSGLPPDRLLVEVTESSVLEDAELAQLAFEQIHDLGARVAIDDFGTGFSSLLYIKRYSVAALKIDRQFVADVGRDGDDDAIVASVVSLARAVRAECIAEGVETFAQLDRLDALGCGYAQGYLLGRPVAGQDLPAAVRAAEALLTEHDRCSA